MARLPGKSSAKCEPIYIYGRKIFFRVSIFTYFFIDLYRNYSWKISIIYKLGLISFLRFPKS